MKNNCLLCFLCSRFSWVYLIFMSYKKYIAGIPKIAKLKLISKGSIRDRNLQIPDTANFNTYTNAWIRNKRHADLVGELVVVGCG